MVLNDIVYKKYGSMLTCMKRRMFEAYEKEEKERCSRLGIGAGSRRRVFFVYA